MVARPLPSFSGHKIGENGVADGESGIGQPHVLIGGNGQSQLGITPERFAIPLVEGDRKTMKKFLFMEMELMSEIGYM